jgi:general secretion pathway protein F
MPVYAYRGLNSAGKQVESMLDAESPRQLRAALRRQGIRVIDHHEQAPGAIVTDKKGSTRIDVSRYFSGRISTQDIALVTRQLATLLKTGIPLVEALGAIVEQLDAEELKKTFGKIKGSVNEGSSLADAMEQHPKAFNKLYISMVKAGEASGALDIVLIRLANFTEAQARLRSKISGALLYPAIMLGVGSIVVLILFAVVIPRVTKIFEQVRAELPIQTKLLIGIANIVQNHWFLLCLFIGGLVYAFQRWKKTEAGRAKWDRWVLVAPLVGKVIRLVAVARFARTLSTLLRSGVPVLSALDITRDVLSNVRLEEVVSDARDAVREGESIAQPFRKSGEFPPIVVHMIAVGERTGKLEDMLESVADHYDFQVEQRVANLTTLIEPIMIVGMGVGVAFIVFSVLMPILQLSQHVRG